MIDQKVFWTLVFFALCCLACYWLLRERKGIAFISAPGEPEKPFIGFQPDTDGGQVETHESA